MLGILILLLRGKAPTAHHPMLFSKELHDTLNEYVRFRHVFRAPYSFFIGLKLQAQWPIVQWLAYLGKTPDPRCELVEAKL